MIRTLSLLGIVTAGGLSLCPLCGSRAGNSDVAAHIVGTQTGATRVASVTAPMPVPTTSVVTLKVTGMTCGGCVIGVRKVLTRLDGVSRADVSYEKGTAIVHFDPSRVGTAQMIAAIRTLGYTAVVAG